MSKVSLDDLRKGAPTALPERTYELCLRGDVLAKIEKLTVEYQDAQVRATSETAPPLRKGEQSPVEEARAQLEAAYEELDEASGDLLLRAVLDGEWRRWVNEHPAREKDQRDAEVAWGICNADDLANDLGKWVVSWNGEPLKSGEWDRLLAPAAAGGDLKALVSLVVHMQEGREDPKLLRRVLLAGQTNNATAS